MRKILAMLLLVAGSAQAQVTPPMPPGWVWFVYQGKDYLRYIHAVPDASYGWGENILTGTIDRGTRKAVNIDNGAGRCVYDIRAEAIFGPPYIIRQHNICANNVIVLQEAPSRVWPPN